jgi:membrane protease YdiL (CAAX protease family)
MSAPPERPAPLPARPELPAGIERPESPDGLPPDRAALPAWPWWAPFAAFLLTIVVAVVGATVVALVAELLGFDVDAGDPPPGVTIGGVVIQDIALIASPFVLARATAGRPRPVQFGLRRVGVGLAVRWTLAAWFAFFLISALWAAALNIDENDDLPQELGADESTLALIVVSVLVTIIAPIAEELFFRGFMFTALRRAWGLVPAVLATGIAFGAVHLGSSEIEFIVPLAVFGAVLCLLYWKTGSLVPSIVLHALNNSVALGVSQKWTWEIPLVAVGACAVIFGVLRPFVVARGGGRQPAQ